MNTPHSDLLRRAATDYRQMAQQMDEAVEFIERRHTELQRGEVESITLLLPSRTSKRWNYWESGVGFRTLVCLDKDSEEEIWRAQTRFVARDGLARPGVWFGTETIRDAGGCLWRRDFDAVTDDFGNLIEVSS